ncbi:MAG TPA: methyltransferase domain-containing protein [Chloroflexota bacterium]|nr:methyltransferase domain-containing protein [Chloroflexota bacterium]
MTTKNPTARDDFDVNEYWLTRGKSYVQEERLQTDYYKTQEQFLLETLVDVGVPIGRVLELGCGFGRITRLLAQAYPQGRIIAVDLSPHQINQARNLCDDCPNVSFQQYDLYSTRPLPGHDFDTAVAIEVLLHHPESVVRDVLRRLASVARWIVNLDWSERWTGDVAEHVWVHDYQAIYRELGISCQVFPLPEKVGGQQQKLFIARSGAGMKR